MLDWIAYFNGTVGARLRTLSGRDCSWLHFLVLSLLHCGFVTDNGDVGPNGRSDEIVGSVRYASAGRDCCLQPSVVTVT